MKSAARGKPISVVEVTNVSRHGFWLLLGERERFLAFEHFPWFRDVSIGELCNVELPHRHHLYWPDLDVDVAVESIDNPERFPLVSRARPNKALQPTSRRGGRAKKRRSSRAARG
jgi:hypothetical protein